MNYVIREGCIQDADQIFRLRKCLAEDHTFKLTGEKVTFDDVENNYANLLNDKDTIIYVAESENKIVGFIEAYRKDRLHDFDEPTIYVLHCYIEPSFRNSRMVHRFLATVMHIGKKEGIQHISAHVFASNEKFYKNIKVLGFNEYKTLFLREI